MRIAFVLPTVGMSGGIRVVGIYAKWLCDRGHNVVLISPPARKPTLRSCVVSLLKGNGWPSTSTVTTSHLDRFNLDHRVLDRYRTPTNRDVPDGDVVIATWWETAEWVSSLSDAKGAKTYFIQGHEVYDHLPIDRCRATYFLPLHKIVIAKWLQDVMRTEYGDSQVDLVPNSVDHQQFYAPIRAKQNVPTVGFLYSHTPMKGVDVTLKVIDFLRKRYSDLRVISFGATRPDKELYFDNQIEFHWSPQQDMLRELYAQCDVWITASRTEGFNLPAMEAMACRTPVVSTRAGWPEEAVKTGWNGVLVDVDDLEALARGAEWVLSLSDDEWRKVSLNAHDTVASSTWNASAELFEKALEHACRRTALGELRQGRNA